MLPVYEVPWSVFRLDLARIPPLTPDQPEYDGLMTAVRLMSFFYEYQYDCYISRK